MTPETPSPGDNDLLAAYYQGDDNAFETLWFGRRKPRRVGYAVRLGGYLARVFPRINEADRDDLVDRVAMKVVESKDNGKFDLTQSFRSWVFRVARNAAIDHLRNRENQVKTGVESEEAGPLDPCDHHVPAANVFDDETVDLAYQAIDRLAVPQRDVLLLRLNGLENQEVATLLGISQPDASKLFKKAIAQVGNVMSEHAPDAADSLNPMTERFFRRLQERHEHELTVALEKMKRHRLTLDSQGRIVGWTEAAQRGDLDHITDHLRGVLPVYLLRQGVPTSHANALHDRVTSRLEKLPPTQRFRDVLAAVLTDYCADVGIAPHPTRDEAEFLHRLLAEEDDSISWAGEMKAWLAQGTIRRLDDLVNPLQWPQSLNDKPSFRNRMRQLHGALLATMRTETELLGHGPAEVV